MQILRKNFTYFSAPDTFLVLINIPLIFSFLVKILSKMCDRKLFFYFHVLIKEKVWIPFIEMNIQI